MAPAGSVSLGNSLVGPLLRRAAFQGTKGRREQDGHSPRGRGGHGCLPHTLLSHYPRSLPDSTMRAACVCVCAGTGLAWGGTRIVLPSRETQRPHKDIDFPPSLPEHDQMSSRSDASLTFQ